MEVLGIGHIFILLTANVPADHRQNTGYIFLKLNLYSHLLCSTHTHISIYNRLNLPCAHLLLHSKGGRGGVLTTLKLDHLNIPLTHHIPVWTKFKKKLYQNKLLHFYIIFTVHFHLISKNQPNAHSMSLFILVTLNVHLVDFSKFFLFYLF